MRLIEKKCPNCGANLEFNESDKTCKCQYCKRSFEIERDLNDVEKFNLIYDKIHKPMKGLFFIPVIAFVIIIIIFVLVFTSINKQVNDDSSVFEEFQKVIVDKENLLTDINEIGNRDFDLIDSNATSHISRVAEGVSDANHSFSVDGDISREKMYVLYKEKENALIIIYKATYRDFFHQEDRHTLYIPVTYQNIEKDILSSLGNAQVTDHIYYLSSDQECFTYGYDSFEEAYKESVESISEGFTITEK